MKYWVLFFTLILSFGCSEDPRYYRKKIEQRGFIIRWYFYSDIGGNSADFVSVEKHGKEEIVFKGTDVITNIIFNDTAIVVKLYKPSRGIVYKDKFKKEIFGLKVLVDSSATSEDYNTMHKTF